MTDETTEELGSEEATPPVRKPRTTKPKEETLNIYQIIAKIREEAGALEKKRAEGGGVPFAFRGIDDVVNHLSPLFTKYGVVAVPNVIQHVTSERAVGNKTVKTTDGIFSYDFYAPDGSHLQASTLGLADDFADRSAAQAQSVAFRVALLQTFFLPTNNNEEAHSEQVKNERESAAPVQQAQPAARPPQNSPLAPLRGQIQAVAKGLGWGPSEINSFGNEFLQKDSKVWFNDAADLQKVLDGLKARAAERAAAQ